MSQQTQSKIILKVIKSQENIQPSPCVCYILRSTVVNKIYIGYTTNFNHRIRQHNGEIAGGAKRTTRFRPWAPVCVIQGFFEQSSALRFEYRLQHPRTRPTKGQDRTLYILQVLSKLITAGDGPKESVIPWPTLTINWYDDRFIIEHDRIINTYV